MCCYCTLTILESEIELNILEEKLNAKNIKYYVKLNTSLVTFNNPKVLFEVMVRTKDKEKSRHLLLCRND